MRFFFMNYIYSSNLHLRCSQKGESAIDVARQMFKKTEIEWFNTIVEELEPVVKRQRKE